MHLGCVDGVIGQHCLPLPLAIRLFRQRAPEVLLSCTRGVPTNSSTRCWKSARNWRWGLSPPVVRALLPTPFREEQNPYCGSAHPFFARADDEPTLDEICAADYVGRGYMAENHRPHDLRFNQGTDAYTMEAIATLVFSGTYIGYLPTHYAATWVAEGRMRAIRPRQLAYDSEFHCITRQGHEERPTPDPVPALAVRGAETTGRAGSANTNGIARQL